MIPVIPGDDESLHSRYALQGTTIPNGCGIVALQAITGKPLERVRTFAMMHGWTPQRGMTALAVVYIAEMLLGTRARGCYIDDPGVTPETYRSEIAVGMAVVEGHVCPILGGRCWNHCGTGRDPIHTVVMF